MTKTHIYSFIGGTDLAHINSDPKSNDKSPILRLMTYLGNQDGQSWHDTTARLFDDSPDDERRERFCERLGLILPQYGIEGLTIERIPLTLKGPTDWSGLYNGVWQAIPAASTSGVRCHIFHLSSGTPTMQATLVLAASCLGLPGAQLFETSNRAGREVVEVELPYLLGLRERLIRERRATLQRLKKEAEKTLQPNTVVHDPVAAASYAALYNSAKRKKPQKLLLRGPTGSGKRHAALQYAHWRGAELVECISADELPNGQTLEGKVVLARWLDAWNEDALKTLTQWCNQNAQVTIIGTWRTDLMPVVNPGVCSHYGLLGATPIELPSLGSRSDEIELAEALARKRGILDGKISDRFQWHLIGNKARNLHDLEALIVTTANYSATPHPDQDGYQRAERLFEADRARANLRNIFEALSGLHFGPGLPTLDERLDEAKVNVIRSALAGGRSQQEVAKLLGMSQQTISRLLG